MKWNWNAAFPPLVLVAVALAQIWRAHAIDQSALKGGGFGIIATTDTPLRRFMIFRVQTAEGEQTVIDVPNYAERLGATTRVAPSESNLELLAEILVRERILRRKSPLSLEGGATESEAARSSVLRFAQEGTRLTDGYEVVPIQSLRIEFWKVDFDSATLTDRASLIRSVTVKAPAK